MSLWPAVTLTREHHAIRIRESVDELRVKAAIAAGGHLVTEQNAPAWWVLADAEGNEACVATWMGRD
jgi:4a-hydroxytetrahydrobiopterin dehydratase